MTTIYRLEGQSDRSQAIILLIHAIVFILTDIALFIAPIRIFSTQMIDKAKMIKVVLIFSVGEWLCIGNGSDMTAWLTHDEPGIITCVAGIVRLSCKFDNTLEIGMGIRGLANT